MVIPIWRKFRTHSGIDYHWRSCWCRFGRKVPAFIRGWYPSFHLLAKWRSWWASWRLGAHL